MHWLIALLLVVIWFTGEGAKEAPEVIEEGGTAGFVPHVALGLAILGLALLRVQVRLGRGAPDASGVPAGCMWLSLSR